MDGPTPGPDLPPEEAVRHNSWQLFYDPDRYADVYARWHRGHVSITVTVDDPELEL